MNAGANDLETRERVLQVTAVDRNGDIHHINNADMGYSYRHSSAADDLIFVEALFEGTPADREEIRKQMDEVQEHRETAQPVRSRTGGSTFKNPDGAKAWQLIDAAGCRGLQIGGAQVSEMHCNFLLNVDEATGHDLELLGETVRARVFQNSGIRLEWEIKRIGQFEARHEIKPFLGKV